MSTEVPKTHPVLEAMLSFGCRSQCKVAIAFQVYMELCEVLALWDVNYSYNKELDLIYLTARKTKTAPLEKYVPLSAKSGVTLTEIDSLQSILCPGEENKCVTLAVKEQDSSIVLYHLAQGLILPDNPEVTLEKKRLEDRCHRLQFELRKSKEDIFMRAQGIEIGGQIEVDSDTQNNVVDTKVENDSIQNSAVCSPIEVDFDEEL